MVHERDRNSFGPDVGEVVLDAVMSWAGWVHRRVESVHPLEGDRGRIRHSIDCTPPPDPRFSYTSRDRKRRLRHVTGEAFVPLALVVKGPMRHLDAIGHDGSPLPLLTMKDGQRITVSALQWALGREGIASDEFVLRVLDFIVGPDGPKLAPEVTELVRKGTWRGERVWRPGPISDELGDLIRDLSTSFLLFVLLPASRLGRRQIVKFSFHWGVRPPVDARLRSRLARPLAAFGLTTTTLQVPMMNAADTESYHFEFRTPPELDCVALTLAGSTSAASRDVSGEPVAHAHGIFDSGHASVASVELRVQRRGAWRLTWWAAVVTAVISVLAVALPGASSVLRDSDNGGAALMLTAPALLIGLAAARRESSLSSWLLSPLRFANVMFALGLFAMAASIAGGLVSPYVDVLWWSVAVVSSTVAVTLSIGSGTLSSRRSRALPMYSEINQTDNHEGDRHDSR